MSQKKLHITMLGKFELGWQDGRSRENFTVKVSPKNRAILCYLVLNNRLHLREELASTFWPDKTEKSAKANLRVALNALRNVGLEPYIDMHRPEVTFNQQANYWCDVYSFEALIVQNWRQPEPDIQSLKKAVDLYEGDFLAGFSQPDLPIFDEWMNSLRMRLDDLVWQALDIIIRWSMKEAADYETGIFYAKRALELAPWRESAHQHLMWLFASSNQRAAALMQYERCRQALKTWLDVDEVSPTTKELMDSILNERPRIQFSTIFGEESEENQESISPNIIVSLYKFLTTQFNLEELRTLCFLLNINYDNLPGERMEGKSRELILYLTRNNKLDLLIQEVRQQRPNANLSFADNELQGQNQTSSREALEFVAEAKLVLVGDGNVGKTSLVNRLVHNTFYASEKMTKGVAITRWYLALTCLDDDQKARINIWDFGGQGNMHATHPYFFSRQAVYLLVLNVREDDRVNRAEYWLRLIRTYGGDSPIIVIANKSDQFSTFLDQRTLKEKYPQITGFARTSCKTNEGIIRLKSELIEAICLLNNAGTYTPQNLVRVKSILEEMTNSQSPKFRDTLSIEEYESICEQNRVKSEQRTGFLRRLSDLGVMLYFGDDPRLGLNVVLNPFWVTEGVYTIINHEPLAKAGGRLNANQVHQILPKNRYPQSKAMYILDMMQKFELCFAIDEQQSAYLLPDLLPPQQPDLPEFNREDSLKLQFEYPIWQGTILTRLIVRLNHYLIEGIYWRNGALFQSFDNKNRALVIADEADRRLRIWVDGEQTTRRNFLNRIREELNVIHNGQRAEDVKELVITPQGGEISYPLLVNLESKGIKTYHIEIGNDVAELSIKELLDGVRADKIPNSYRLKELIVERLNLDELDDLCFRFKIGLEDIEGEMTRDSKARNLIRQFERAGRMPELMAILRGLHGNMSWI